MMQRIDDFDSHGLETVTSRRGTGVVAADVGVPTLSYKFMGGISFVDIFSCLDHTFPVHFFYQLYMPFEHYQSSTVNRSFPVLLQLKKCSLDKKVMFSQNFVLI